MLSQATACTVHTALHSAEHTQPLLQRQYLLSLACCPSSLLFLLLAFTTYSVVLRLCLPSPSPPLSFSLSLPLSRLFPESLRWLLATQHYRRSKAMMLRIARKNQVDMTTEPSGVLAGEDDFRRDAG